MTGTTSKEATSDGKLCVECQSPFDSADDKRFSQCAACRNAASEGATMMSAPAIAKTPDVPHSEPEYEAIHIDAEALAPPPVEDRSFYWCGATLDCPMDITLGGIEFPKTIGRVRRQQNGQSVLEVDYRDGQIHRLTDKTKDLVLEHASNRVIRDFRKDETKAINGDTDTRYLGTLKSIRGRRTYTPRPGDLPLGQFVYMVKVRHAKDRPIANPPTMVPRDW